MEPLSLPLGREWRKAPAFRRGRATSPPEEVGSCLLGSTPPPESFAFLHPSPDEGEKSLSPVRLCLTPPL